MNKISVRFFDDREVRAVWDENKAKWYFSLIDIISVLKDEDDYEKARNYWKYFKAKLKREGNQLGSVTIQLKMTAADGKIYRTNVLDYDQVIALGKIFPSNKVNRFIEWFIQSDETIDGKSRLKAYALFESGLLESMEVGTVKGLQQIHAYIFGGLYDFAGQIRTVNISKGGFTFAPVMYLERTFRTIESMKENSFQQIVNKYVEMNIAHPFREGNGRATRIWLDQMLKKNLQICIDWSKIDKKDYLAAMAKSVSDSKDIQNLLQGAITDKIADRQTFMKGIDYSYYYEEDVTIQP